MTKWKFVGSIVIPGFVAFISLSSFMYLRSNSETSISIWNWPSVIFGGNTTVSTTNNINLGSKDPAAGSAEAARKDLRDRQMPFTTSGFEVAASSESPSVIDLYLQAGMSPNAIGASLKFFILTLAIIHNPGNKREIIDVFCRHGINFKTINDKSTFPYLKGVSPTLEDEAFEFSMLNNQYDSMRYLMKVGADPSHIISVFETACHDSLGSRQQMSYLDRDMKKFKQGGIPISTCPPS